MKKHGTIIGLGYCLPENIVHNADLEKLVDTSDKWIRERTGIKRRRILEKEKPSSDMGVKAAKDALKNSKTKAEDIDLIIVSTESPDYLTPSMACVIQDGIDANNAAAFDLNAACSGFVYALTVSDQFIQTGMYKNILIIACEGLSKVVDWKDRNTCVLFGDGAGACVMTSSDKPGIINYDLGADGTKHKAITIPCTHFDEDELFKRNNKRTQVIFMEGREVFKFAVNAMTASVNKLLKEVNMNIDEIDWIVPHQANMRIITNSIKKLNFPMEKVVITLDEYGNTSSASIPIALAESYEVGKIKSGDYVVLVGFGGGLTWASILIKWA
ncbi:MAG: ketoacyl-ACP synthase III [Clostridiales bacterium]|nr:ketoacyl-ACP synthase III [Clostridiales bacterium]